MDNIQRKLPLIPKIVAEVFKKFAFNLWPKAIFPGEDASMTYLSAGMLITWVLFWTAIVQPAFFLRAEDDFYGAEDEYVGAEDEYVGSEYLGEEPSILDSLSETLGSFFGATPKVQPKAVPASAAQANKAVVNKTVNVAKKAYRKPFIQRFIWNLVYWYIISLVLLQIASLQATDAKWLNIDSLSRSSAYYGQRRRYAPYTGPPPSTATAYQPSYR